MRAVLEFDAGYLVVRGASGFDFARYVLAAPTLSTWPWVMEAKRKQARIEAYYYAPLLRTFKTLEVNVTDKAKAYLPIERKLSASTTPRPRSYQRDALLAWKNKDGRGVVVLPTGAGKTLVAAMAMYQKARPTMIITPTLDLVRQWHETLGQIFQAPIGKLGGGKHDIQEITVSTYDSAHLHMADIGHRFGLLVFDECHHLPSPSYAAAARKSIAPFRLGLTATLERADGLHTELGDYVGPIVYQQDIKALSGEFLARYAVRRIEVRLSEAERELYERERNLYRSFVKAHRIDLSSASGWKQFIVMSARSKEGKRAMEAFRKQREVAFSAQAKYEVVRKLLKKHECDRTILFTQDNAMALSLAERFSIPVITHKSKKKERSKILEDFKNGAISALACSKVLNEGVDVPEASVGVVISGSGSVREHVQRLGRILRPKKNGQQAVLYELISHNTTETWTSERRRSHQAYRS